MRWTPWSRASNTQASSTSRPSCSTRPQAPIGARQPPARAARQARSARTAACDAAWSRATSCDVARASPARTCTTSAPWETAGQNRGGASTSVIRLASPSRASPAPASTSASYSPSSSLRRRVSTFPRMGRRWRSGRTACTWTTRRMLDEPTTAPAGRSASVGAVRPTSTSKANARSGTQASSRPGVSAVGMSLRLCTAASMRPSSRARSSSRTNTPSLPRVAIGTSPPGVPWSARVVSVTTSTDEPAARRLATTSPVCVTASELARVPMRSGKESSMDLAAGGGMEFGAAGTGVSGRRHRHRDRLAPPPQRTPRRLRR